MASNSIIRNPSFLTRPLEVLSTSPQLKLSYDADSFATIAVADNSHTSITAAESGNVGLYGNNINWGDNDGENISNFSATVFGATWTSSHNKGMSLVAEYEIGGALNPNIKMSTSNTVIVDKDWDLQTDATQTAFQIDYDITGIVQAGQLLTATGADIDMNCQSITHIGTVNQTGIDLDMVAAADGTQSNVGIDVACSGSDTCTGITIDTTVDASGACAGIYIDNKNGGTDFKNVSSADATDYFTINTIAAGATTLTTVDTTVGATAHLSIVADGHVEFDNCAAGFDQVTVAFNASATTVDFTTGNKQHLTLEADVTNLFFKFPATSGNFLCVVLQDGTGGWNVTNFKGLDSAGSSNANGAGTDGAIRWAGGLTPDLTETANKADILTFYWDATSANEIAYGVVTENF